MIGLSPLSTGHPLRFQPKWVRASTGSYPRFTLPMDSSPGFASAACDSSRPVQARFRCGSVSLNLAACRDSQAHSTKGTRSPSSERLPLLGGARFQALFHSPLGVLFTFPSRYWFAIGHRRVLSLGGWSPQIPTGFHVSGGTRDASHGRRDFGYGALTLSGRPSQAVPLKRRFVTMRRSSSYAMEVPRHLLQQRLEAYTCKGLGCCAFARRYSRSLG